MTPHHRAEILNDFPRIDELFRTMDMVLIFRQGTTGRIHPNAPASFWRIPTPRVPILRSRVELREGLILVNYVICKDSGAKERNLVILDWKSIDPTVFVSHYFASRSHSSDGWLLRQYVVPTADTPIRKMCL